MPIPLEIVNKQDIEELKRHKADFPVMQKHLDDAKRAGIDVEDAQKRFDATKKQIEQLLAVYGKTTP